MRTRECLPVSPPLQKHDQYTGNWNEINRIIVPNGYSFERGRSDDGCRSRSDELSRGESCEPFAFAEAADVGVGVSGAFVFSGASLRGAKCDYVSVAAGKVGG